MVALEVVEVLGLLDAVGEHVHHRHGVADRQADAQARVVERQEVEEVGAREVVVVLGVVGLVAEVRGELAEVGLQAAADREDVAAVGLPDVAVDVGARLVGGAALHRLGGLAELEVDAGAEAAAGGDVGRAVDDDRRLLDAEDVGAGVVGAQQVDRGRTARSSCIGRSPRRRRRTSRRRGRRPAPARRRSRVLGRPAPDPAPRRSPGRAIATASTEKRTRCRASVGEPLGPTRRRRRRQTRDEPGAKSEQRFDRLVELRELSLQGCRATGVRESSRPGRRPSTARSSSCAPLHTTIGSRA